MGLLMFLDGMPEIFDDDFPEQEATSLEEILSEREVDICPDPFPTFEYPLPPEKPLKFRCRDQK